MSDIMVRFLNESYTFPEELKQYVIYCNEFEKINNRLQKELICTMKKKPYLCCNPACTHRHRKR